MSTHIHIFHTEHALHEACADRVVQIAAESVAARGAFHLALAGGNTPAGLYAELALPAYAARIDWDRTHVFFGDERCVPADHCDSNYRMARERLLDRVALAADHVHRVHGESHADKAAADYARVVTETVPAQDGLPNFDLVLLGVGLDGHVASLFPDTDILHKRKAAAAVYVEKLGAWRVSLTLPVINNARHVLLLVAGAKKADVVRHVLRSAPGATPLPVQMLRPAGELEWYMDAEAARYVSGEAQP